MQSPHVRAKGQSARGAVRGVAGSDSAERSDARCDVPVRAKFCNARRPDLAIRMLRVLLNPDPSKVDTSPICSPIEDSTCAPYLCFTRRVAYRLDLHIRAVAPEISKPVEALRVKTQRLGNSRDGPASYHAAPRQPTALPANGMKQTHADGNARRRRHRQAKSGHNSRESVNCDRQPRPTKVFAGIFIDDANVHFHMVDHDNL